MTKNIKTVLDATINGLFIELTTENALQLIEWIVTSNLLWNDDIISKKSTKIYEVDLTTMVSDKLDVLMKKLERLDMKAVDVIIQCEICIEGHASINYSVLNAFPNEQT